MRISDWSSDVCSSDLIAKARGPLLEMILRCRRRYGLTIGPGYLTFCDTFRGRHRVAPRSRRQPQQLRRSLPPVRTEPRSEERIVGKERVSSCRSRWSQYHETKTIPKVSLTYDH